MCDCEGPTGTGIVLVTALWGRGLTLSISLAYTDPATGVDTEVLPLGYLVEKRPSVKLDQTFGVGLATFDVHIFVHIRVLENSFLPQDAHLFIKGTETDFDGARASLKLRSKACCTRHLYC